MARKSKLTPWRHRRIIGYIKNGVPNVHACQLVGIDESTFYKWLKRAVPTEENPQPEARYIQFFQSVKKAEAGFIESNLGVIRRAATEPTVIVREHVRKVGDKTTKEITKETRPPTWAPAAWLLERRWPDLFGRRLGHSGEISTPSPPKIIKVLFSDNEVQGEADP